ncbi:hypothetical protein [Pseudoalteromonas sp. PS5]|uniref:hypothetical protein n=1 Tax=Pseudoalteromonas sp. PS5 TaxID=1437473 RepID=UPI000FFEE613|nr:hypothetical protein [Pseudoalteromonas sp. PS5]RXF01034.1 hypothetical protein D9603_14125 [Pseudoalteromonas sp. PS5]
MTAAHYWISSQMLVNCLSEYLPTFKGSSWSSDHNEGALFLLDSREPEALAAYLRHQNGLSKTQVNNMLTQPSKPMGWRDRAQIAIDGSGGITFSWPDAQRYLCYPPQLEEGEVKSFAFLMSNTSDRATLDSQLSVRTHIFFVGSVGAKGSGAELEIEKVDEYKNGRPLYVPDNKVTTPFNIYNTHIDRLNVPQPLSLIGTNGIRVANCSTNPSSNYWRPFKVGGVWGTTAASGGSYVKVDFKEPQKEITGLFVEGQLNWRYRLPRIIKVFYTLADGVERTGPTFDNTGSNGIVTLTFPDPLKGVVSMRFELIESLAKDKVYNRWSGHYNYYYHIAIEQMVVLGCV